MGIKDIELSETLKTLAQQKLQGLVLAVINEKGDLETAYIGNAQTQTFLLTVASSHIHTAIHNFCTKRIIEKRNTPEEINSSENNF